MRSPAVITPRLSRGRRVAAAALSSAVVVAMVATAGGTSAAASAGSKTPAHAVRATRGTSAKRLESPIRVLSYNSLDASFDGERHPGGIGAPFAKRLPGQLALIQQSKAAVVGIEEANACLHPNPSAPCWRQIDALNRGLTQYTLVNTSQSTYYDGNYILYNPQVVTPVREGGDWAAGPMHPAADNRFSAFQVFRINATGAEFLFVVVHTLAPAGLSYDRIRGQETQNTINAATAYAKRVGVGPTLYVGDFNSYRGEWHVHDYSGQAIRKAGIHDGILYADKLVNAKYDSINELYRHARKGHGSADHIYGSGGVGFATWGELLHLKHGNFVGTIPSDHNPVYADVEIPY